MHHQRALRRPDKQLAGLRRPAAVYQKTNISIEICKELFTTSFKIMISEGYLEIMVNSFDKKKEENEKGTDSGLMEAIKGLKKGAILPCKSLYIKEGETSPPKKYSSGSIILAMESAGQLIEDEDLRAQIKGSGIGTSATRAEILKKLVNIKYISLNKKTQIITPTLLGELIYNVVDSSIHQLLNPELTASWEKGLTYVADGSITTEEYMEKLENFVSRRTYNVLKVNNQYVLRKEFDDIIAYYK